MPYATDDQLRNHLGVDRYEALVDRDLDGSPDTDGVALALENASSMADSYIARWLPVGTPPVALVHAVLDVTVYILAGNRTTEDERKRYEDVMRWFRDLAAGRASLGGPTEPAGGDAIVSADPAQFTWAQTRGVL